MAIPMGYLRFQPTLLMVAELVGTVMTTPTIPSLPMEAVLTAHMPISHTLAYPAQLGCHVLTLLSADCCFFIT